jgi:hypothetical protein
MSGSQGGIAAFGLSRRQLQRRLLGETALPGAISGLFAPWFYRGLALVLAFGLPLRFASGVVAVCDVIVDFVGGTDGSAPAGSCGSNLMTCSGVRLKVHLHLSWCTWNWKGLPRTLGCSGAARWRDQTHRFGHPNNAEL